MLVFLLFPIQLLALLYSILGNASNFNSFNCRLLFFNLRLIAYQPKVVFMITPGKIILLGLSRRTKE